MKRVVIITVVVLFFIGMLFYSHIEYFLSGGNNVIISEPEIFCFGSRVEQDVYEVYYLSDGEDEYDKETGTYHLYVDGKYLNNDDAYLYMTGNCWNYPYAPTIKVDGVIANNTDTGRSGYGGFLYHLTYDNTVRANHTYTFYVRCGKKSTSLKIVFHEM